MPLKHRPKTHRENKAEKYTMYALVTMATGHSGHIEDLLKKPRWQCYSPRTLRAETQTVAALHEPHTSMRRTNALPSPAPRTRHDANGRL